MKSLFDFGTSSMKEGTSAQLSCKGELHGEARATTLVTLRKCTLGLKREIKILAEAVAAGSPYRCPLWLARALNSPIYDVKWDYEGYRTIATIAVFYVTKLFFYNKFMLLYPIL